MSSYVKLFYVALVFEKDLISTCFHGDHVINLPFRLCFELIGNSK